MEGSEKYGCSSKKLLQSVDGISGEDNVTKMWKDKIFCNLNDVYDAPDKEDLRKVLSDFSKSQI